MSVYGQISMKPTRQVMRFVSLTAMNIGTYTTTTFVVATYKSNVSIEIVTKPVDLEKEPFDQNSTVQTNLINSTLARLALKRILQLPSDLIDSSYISVQLINFRLFGCCRLLYSPLTVNICRKAQAQARSCVTRSMRTSSPCL